MKEREKLIKAVTNETQTSKFIEEVGSKAIVDRSVLRDTHLDELREVIADVGRDLQEVKAVPKELTYRGSLCVHIYTSAALRNAAFATTNYMGTMTADLADGALRELTGTTMEGFGKRRAKLRSGF